MLSFGLWMCVIWLVATFITPSVAQTSRLFQWGFANTALSTSLPTCYSLPIIVKPFNITANDTVGTPPYYMIAFVVGGTPVTTFIGTDANNLTWTITEPVGSQLVLSVVDANGSAGGIPPRIFTVIAGSTTQCVTTPISTPAFTVTANVTGDLQTCQPWGFTVKGGVPPYTITFAQPNSPVVTNVTMPFGDDAFTFIDRADPNGQLIGAISDLTGRWATGTPIVNTKGSSDVSCVGLVSSSGNATQIQQGTNAPNNALSASKKKNAVAVGLSITVLLLFLLTLGVGSFIYLRRRRRRNEEFFIATIPRQFVEVEAQRPSIPNPNPNPNPSQSRLAPTSTSTSMSASRPTLPEKPQPARGVGVAIPPEDRYRPPPASENASTAGLSYYPSIFASDGTINSRTPASTHASHSGFTNFPASSIRRSAKAKSIEAAREMRLAVVASDSEYVLETALSDSSNVLGRQLSVVSGLGRGGGGGGRAPFRGLAEERVEEEEPEIVYQHRDAGMGVVTELPPPYADRGVPSERPNQ